MKKLFSICVVCLLLSGCGSSSKTGENEKYETFTVGMECNYAPFNWQTKDATDTSAEIGGAGYCDGYDVRVAKQIARDLNRDLIVKKIAWDGLQPALESGEIDAIIAGMTKDEERENGIDFTSPYYESEMVMIVRKADDVTAYRDIQQFTDKNIIGQKNTNYDTIIEQIKGVHHMTPKATYPEMILSLQNKEVDGITAELPVAEGVIEANDNLAIVHFAEGKGFDIDTSVSVGLKEGTRDAELFHKVQNSLDNITSETRETWMKEARDNQPKAE